MTSLPTTPPPITPVQIRLIQSSFAIVFAQKATAARIFYARLFDTNPALRPMFRSDMPAQGEKLMDTLAYVVRNLSATDALINAARAMGYRHAGYGVRPEHYPPVGEALIWTLGKSLGPRFSDECELAWREAYAMLADIMSGATQNPPGPLPEMQISVENTGAIK